MASQGGASRLTQIQMRFQQRQQQEREQRKSELAGGKLTAESVETRSLNSSFGAGKVRQMFDERRQRSTGIDKSYPLKPISTSGKNAVNSITQTTTVRKQVTRVQQSNKKITTDTLLERSIDAFTEDILSNNSNSLKQNNRINENNDHIDYNTNSTLNSNISTKAADVRKQTSDDYIKLNSFDQGDRNNNDSNRTLNNTNMKLKPVVTKKPVQPEKKTLRKNDTGNLPSRSVQKNSRTPESKPTVAVPKTNEKANLLSSPKKPLNYVRERVAADSVSNNMAICRICNRKFNVDRIGKHQEICEKTATKKRRTFDASKHRIQGTEAEQFVRKAFRSTKEVATKSRDIVGGKKSNWRTKHEEFIQAIRAAKEVQAHLAKGGKLSDLPPPPPSENPDYIQCPHCKRRFNEGAASRHIPKCATMLHNKPKPVKKVPNRR